MHSPLLAPLVALVAWSLVMWAWMYATRLPAIVKARMKLDPYAPRGEQMNQLPPEVRWKADNYNHLMEQPTIFYALAFMTYLAGHENGTTAMLAWAYVGLRVVHSLIQCTVNNVMARFTVFSISTIVLIIWAAIEVMAIL